jgi:hypothetical protein
MFAGALIECVVMLVIFGCTMYGGGQVLDLLGTKMVSQPEAYLMQNFLTTIGFGDFKAETVEQKMFFYAMCVAVLLCHLLRRTAVQRQTRNRAHTHTHSASSSRTLALSCSLACALFRFLSRTL